MSVKLKTLMVAAALASALAAGYAAQQRQGQPEVIVGGVGATSQQNMRDAAPNYGLGMTFADRTGAYIADVGVTVRDSRGRDVVSTVSEGPMMLVDLPGGRYTVQATYDGRTQQRQVSVPEDGHRQLVMHW